MAVLLFLAGFSQRVNAQCGSSVPIVYYADNTSNRYSNGGGGNLMPFVTVSDIAGGTFVDVASGSSLEGVSNQVQATVYRMDGAPASGGAYDTSKYYSLTITTSANAPVMKFNSFGAQALTTGFTAGEPISRLHYWLGGAIVDQSTGIETSVFNTNITNGHNSDNNPRYAAVDYNLQPGRTYTLKLYAAGGYQGRVYMDNPRLQFAPIPKVNNASLCLSDLSGTVGTALASRVTSTTPSDTQLRWFSGGTEVTGQPIATGTYTARYYTTAGACNGADSETITVGTTCTPACLPFGSTFSFTNTGNTSTAGYTTKYVLVNNSGNIIQEVTSGFTVPSTAGNYSVYAVNYADADLPNLAAGTPIADVIADTGCVSASAPLNFEVCDTPIVPDIAVNKVGPISAQIGSTISYNVHVTNNGPGNATDVVVKDPAVANFTVTSVTCSAGAGIGGTAVCPSSVTIAGLQGAAGLTIPSLPAGSGITFTVTGTVDGTTGEVITNIATVEYAGDINPSNNNSIVQTNIFKCLTEESTYTVDAEATKALASNVIAPNGGVINLVYKLTSGPAVPGIGNEFTQTVTYSDLNNNFGIDNQWEGLDVATFGTSKLFVLSPKTSAGTGRLYNSLPVNNSTNETLMASNNRGDNIFTSKIADGNLDELGRFTISIGNFPAAPAGYVSTAGSFRVYANGNTSYLPDAATATANSSGFWLKPLIQTGIRNDGSEGVPPIYMMAGNTYEWRYSAFSNGTNFATNYFGTATTARGVLFYHTNSITFAKAPMDCACYKPGLLDPTKELPTKVGITSLSRAGSDNPDNWPMVRKGGHIALESQTKGFVPNRVAFSGGNPVGIPTADYVEGMMVYDTTNKCMKIYTLKDGDASMAWHCVTNQTCPDVSTSFTLNCSQATVSGDTHLDPNVNFTITIPYLNGDGTSYAEQIIPSTVTPGLTAVLAAGTLANGSGNLVLTVSGPSSSSSQGGAYYFEVSINGKVCNILVSITAEPPIT